MIELRHDEVHLTAQALCECDGRDSQTIVPADLDRYARTAILIHRRPKEFRLPRGATVDPLVAADPSVVRAE